MNSEILSQKTSERQSANWDLSNAFRNYSVLVITQICSAFFSFALVWIITKYFGVEGYGGVFAFIAASQITQIFVNWTNNSVTRFGVEEFVQTGKITQSFWSRIFILLPNLILVIALAFLWLPLISSWLELPAEYNWLLVVYLAMMSFWLHILQSVQAVKIPHLQGFLTAMERFGVLVFLIILAISGKFTYLGVICGFILSPFITGLIGLFKIRKFLSWELKFDWIWVKNIFKYSFPLIPFTVLGYLSSGFLDAIFITKYLSKADLGIYSLAYQINSILMLFPTLAGSLLLSLFITLQTNKDTGKINLFMREVLPLMVFCSAISIVIISYLMQFLIPLIWHKEFDQSVLIFGILISSTIFAIPTLIGYAPYYNSVSATYVASINAVVSALVNISANFILIPQYGLKGCAWATVTAYGIGFLVTSTILKYRFGLKFTWAIPATFPVLVGSAIASTTDSFGIALLISLLFGMLIFFVFKKEFIHSLKTLRDHRKLLLGNN